MMATLRDNLLPLSPELFLLGSAIALLMGGVFGLPRITSKVMILVSLVLGITMLFVAQTSPQPVVVLGGMLMVDGFASFTKLILLGGALLALLIGWRWLTEASGKPFEFLVITLLSIVGMMLMLSAHNLIALYMGLEMMSLALYVLAAFERDDARSSEAGLKYFVLGALSSGMLLFGMSLVYGITGATGFEDIAAYIAPFIDEAGGNRDVPSPLILGVVLMLVGFCFKVSAVPFHMWTPDVYEGAPTPVTAFFAIAPKVAAFALLARVLLQPFGDLVPAWQQIIVFVSVASMLVGALAALRQTNIKRLLAYSSISHAGFMLMGLATGTESGVQAMLIYLSIYIFMSAAAFGCVLLMRRAGVYVEAVADLSGLAKTQPFVALAFAASMFAMAGIPPLAGFYGKMFVVLAAFESGLIVLGVVGLLSSVIAAYYYLRVIKFMYFDEPHDVPFDMPTPWPARIALTISTLVMLVFFLIPSPLVTSAREAAGILLR